MRRMRQNPTSSEGLNHVASAAGRTDRGRMRHSDSKENSGRGMSRPLTKPRKHFLFHLRQPQIVLGEGIQRRTID